MNIKKRFSENSRLNKLLENVVSEVQSFAEGQMGRIQRLTQIGIALSAEKNIDKLLEMIVDEAIDFTNADAGTLYTVDDENKCLNFRILKNLTLKTSFGGVSGGEIKLPPVPLEVDGQLNFANVSSRSALTGEIINIPDVYKYKGFDFTGPKKYDKQTGYRSKSMLVIPMKDHKNDIIGVLQLLNAQDFHNGDIIPFAPENVDLIISLASQAAVALENAQLIVELKALFDAFIQSIATAIDEKSPYTAGHISRVTELTMMIAREVNKAENGPFADVHFTEDQLEELRIAAWMHDVGKITTPEHVVDKSRKLETISDRIEFVNTRFDFIRQNIEITYLNDKLALMQKNEASQKNLKKLDEQFRKDSNILKEERQFVEECNTAGEWMSDDKVQRLNIIARKKFKIRNEEHYYLSENELENLSIRKGTLTVEERKIIENHALVSIKILSQLPFPKNLAKIPEYAGGHHEKLDGSGYPFGLTAKSLPLQARIMAIADIFEALTAKDRPYKKPMNLSTAIKILNQMQEQNHIDSDILKLFLDSGVYKEYAKRELNKEQIDVID